MTGFISFVGAFHMTMDIIKTKWKSLLLACASMYGVMLFASAIFNFPVFGAYSYRPWVYFFGNFLAPFIPYTIALFYGFLFISYIVENYFRDKKETLNGAFEFFAARFKNYILLTWVFILIIMFFWYLTTYTPKYVFIFCVIILCKFLYSFFATAFFNYDTAGALKSAARLTKGFSGEIFMRSVMLMFFGYVFIFISFFFASFFMSYSNLTYFLNIFIMLTFLVFFVIYHSVMFLSLFNLKKKVLD